MTLRIKSPLEKIINELHKIGSIGDLDLTVVIRMVQKFAEELEHEREAAKDSLVSGAVNMEGVGFQRGRIYQIKKLQRDFEVE